MRPVTAALTGVTVFPLTGDCAAVTVEPYPVVRPYSNVTVVEAPFAFTVPLRVAPVEVMELAAVVTTVGACAVLNVNPR